MAAVVGRAADDAPESLVWVTELSTIVRSSTKIQ